MPSTKVIIASVLKPVDDIRSYRKMAKSITGINNMEVHVFGYPSEDSNLEAMNIWFYPSKKFRPKSIYRFTMGLRLLSSFLKLKPDILIVNTHELLFAAFLIKVLSRCKIVYDIRENYFLNLSKQKNYGNWLGLVTGRCVRLKEQMLSYFFDHFILAEHCYSYELNFVKRDFTIIENKALSHESISPKSELKTIIFTGTLTKSNGALQCLSFMKTLHAYDQRFKFIITGHCPDEHLYQTIMEQAYGFIVRNISKSPIPYHNIQQTIAQGDIGLICYTQNPSNVGCMPTKVFEYGSAGVCMLYESGAAWSRFIEKHQLGIEVNFSNTQLSELAMKLTVFQENTNLDTSLVLWDREIKKIQNLILDLR